MLIKNGRIHNGKGEIFLEKIKKQKFEERGD